ncbi:hypothetical protein A0H81_14089 [Grifola frondosa]|uniref:Uncharacterized protein n=1 Tax=Grifola frondosa TaxID=5627 RepID=A0A1C7LNY2_GRIFR|nr:hypothetical protein A0H81_14089 [Grifola frondosa]
MRFRVFVLRVLSRHTPVPFADPFAIICRGLVAYIPEIFINTDLVLGYGDRSVLADGLSSKSRCDIPKVAEMLTVMNLRFEDNFRGKDESVRERKRDPLNKCFLCCIKPNLFAGRMGRSKIPHI